ncbi:hypothetical protein LEP1GSC070_2007 [Leptospira santarosai str. AIM]|nr:hypothetical protein LEP1GSC070_2007 [Leptospira santarosai str. AIM]
MEYNYFYIFCFLIELYRIILKKIESCCSLIFLKRNLILE